ncbi:hypothetical protein SDC9_190568 [bioreactor metagenome]|uniref:Uncharacterized protein n=1 Tax=bioreactor metagenome TaxID=1076179 RepID=A0A645HXU2_9ZZZZ
MIQAIASASDIQRVTIAQIGLASELLDDVN